MSSAPKNLAPQIKNIRDMRVSEIIRQHTAGKRDFREVNLRGQSFNRQDLSGANFSNADIRGANFNMANLREANFSYVKAGLQRPCFVSLLILSLLLSVLACLAAYYAGSMIVITIDKYGFIANIAVLIVFAIFFRVILSQGVGNVALGTLVVTFAFAALIVLVFEHASLTVAVIQAVALTIAVAGFLLEALAITLLWVVIENTSRAVTIAFLAIMILVSLGLGATWKGIQGISLSGNALFVAVALGLIITALGVYLGLIAAFGNPKQEFIRQLAVTIAATGGTSFRGANLTDANFMGARLKSTDFREATITRVRWYGAKMLDRVRPGDTHLQYTQIRQWLIGKGQNKNFDNQNLRGVNFQGADLTDASFIDANLSGANLQDADLSRAKLVQTPLDGTDFTGATLTGACIEDWGITTHTKLAGVKCEYVFMRLPTKEDPNPRRKPDNWDENFEGDDFADFIKPIFDTLDLYHNQGVDPRAIAISWKQLAENNPDANLRFASMEVKGKNNLLLRLKTAPTANLSQLNAEYFENYNYFKALVEAESKKLLVEKDNRIQQLENMVNTALKRPSFYAEHYQGETVMIGEKRNIENQEGNYNENIKGNYYEQKGNFGIGHMSGGEIKGNAKVAGVINEAENQNLADAATEIQQLLEQLSTTYPTSTNKEKIAVIGEAVDQIENNPTLKAKVINALKAGGTEAFKEAVNHPLVNILVATIEGWQDS